MFCKEIKPAGKRMQEHCGKDYVKIPCADCGKHFEKRLLLVHKNGCPKRLLTCRYCDVKFPYSELEEHQHISDSRASKCQYYQDNIMWKDCETRTQMSCPKMLCPNNCGRKILLLELAKHLKYCSPVLEECPVCKKVVKDLKRHIQECRRRSVLCRECNNDIPWVDLNVHLAYFCDAAYKEEISNENKETVMKHKTNNLSSSKMKGLENLSQNLERLFLEGHLSDIKLKVRGQEFSAHKSVLGSQSPVFLAMFQHEMVETISGVVEINDMDPKFFRDFLLFIYTGKCECVTPKNAVELYKAANKYDLQELKKECVLRMKATLSLEIILDVILLANNYEETELFDLATKFFLENAESIYEMTEFDEFFLANFKLAKELTQKALKKAKKNPL